MFDEYADLPDDDEVANPWTHLPTESPPDWLVDLQCRLNISTFRAFLGSRVVFYPYARSDGTPFEVFGGRNHAAHCFLHVDEHLSQTDLEDQLAPAHPRRIRGYTPVDDTLTRLSSQQFMELVHDINPAAQPDNADLQFSLWTVLARDDGFDDCHGPVRIAFLHVRSNPEWLYRVIWSNSQWRPFAAFLRSGSPDGTPDFPLERVALDAALPDWLISSGPSSEAAEGDWHSDSYRLTARKQGFSLLCQRLYQRS